MSNSDDRAIATIRGLALALFLTALWPGPAGATGGLGAISGDSWQLCAHAVGRAERALMIPTRLLSAISLVESGRWNEATQAVLAWPWTVMAEGQGRYLPSKAAAIAEVRKLQTRGIGNIDVGCMQVNLRYHPDAFASLDEAFDPARNVAYAAQFLKRLRDERRSWAKAVAYYHSATPTLHRRYRAKVYEAWRAERRRVFEARRRATRQERASRSVALEEPGAPGAIGSRALF